MEFFDCNLRYGTPYSTQLFNSKPCPTLGELEDELDRAGIAGGLVYTLAQDFSGTAMGNRLLAEDLKTARHQLWGMYSLLPSCTEETCPPEELYATLLADHMGAVRLAPDTHGWLQRPGVVGDYLALLTELRIPVMLDTSCGMNAEFLWDTLTAFPALTAIVSVHNVWPLDRMLRPFLENFPNTLLDLSMCLTDQGIGSMVRRYGAERLLFGTKFPLCYMGGQMLHLRHALDVTEEEKTCIAGGNLRRAIQEAGL